MFKKTIYKGIKGHVWNCIKNLEQTEFYSFMKFSKNSKNFNQLKKPIEIYLQ